MPSHTTSTNRETYEKQCVAGSKSMPKCLRCGQTFDVMDLSLVEQQEVIEGNFICEKCRQ